MFRHHGSARLFIAGSLSAAMLCLSCCRQETKVAAAVAPATQPATKPFFGGHRVLVDTVFRRSVDGAVVFDTVDAGTHVMLVSPGAEFSRVQLEGGEVGEVPNNRLDPTIRFEPRAPLTAPLPPPGRSQTSMDLSPLPPPGWTTMPQRTEMPASVSPATIEVRGNPSIIPPWERKNITPLQLRAFRADARKFLLAQRKPTGDWESVVRPVAGNAGFAGERWGVASAVATLALLSDQKPAGADGGELAPSLKWLNSNDLSPEAVAWLAHVYALAPPKTLESAGKHAFVTLGPVMRGDGLARGLFVGRGGNVDLRLSSLATLGLASAERNSPDIEIPQTFWKSSDSWLRLAANDGSWLDPVGPVAPPELAKRSAGAIAAVVACLRQAMHRGGAVPGDARLYLSVQWLDANARWLITDLDGLIAARQVADALGRRRIGDVDWFAAGVHHIVSRQRPDGAIADVNIDSAERVYRTALAMLFLAEADVPVAVNKLVYSGKDGIAGDDRAFDAAALAESIGRTLERRCAWQRVDLHVNPEDLFDAPILLLCGHGPIDMDEPSIQLLREYVNAGGLIVGNADDNSPQFAIAFSAVARTLFPGREFRDLPPEHPVFNLVYRAKQWKQKFSIAGMSNGVREQLLLIKAGDPSLAWQAGGKAALQGAEELGINLSFYPGLNALDRPRSQMTVRVPVTTGDPQVEVGMLRAGPNPLPEPGAWPRVAESIRADKGVRVGYASVRLAANPSLKRYALLHLTGTGKLRLDEDERGQLREYIAAGGTLLVDAAGGDKAFAASAMDEVVAITTPLGGTLPRFLTADDALYTKFAKLPRFAYRQAMREALADHAKEPRLLAIKVNDRNAVYFSREDLIAGMAGIQNDSLLGYDVATATAIAESVVLSVAGDVKAEKKK